MRVLLALIVACALSGCSSLPTSWQDLVGPRASDRISVIASDPANGTVSVTIETLGVVEAGTSTYGLETPATVTVQAHGTGHVLIRSPFGVAADTKQSVVDGARAAAYVADVDARSFNFTVTLDKDAGPMSGPSAGSQFALGFYVALNNLLAPDHAIHILAGYAGTGTIDARGAVGPVGGIEQKAEAAAAKGDLFVYPNGAVYDDQSLRRVDMARECLALKIQCEQVGTLGELIQVATVVG